MSGDLRSRLSVAGVGVPACVLVVYVGGPLFAIGLGAVAAIGFWEYASMIRSTGTRVLMPLGAVAALLFPLVMMYGGFPGSALYSAALLMGFAALAVARIPLEERPILSAGVTSFGVLYVAGLLSFGVPLREGWLLVRPIAAEPSEPLARTLFFFYPVVVTWIADTAAYFG
ncbi:MAG: phosphatidate cytidylyltransferase, partial [Gemmatimonadota bacterium]